MSRAATGIVLAILAGIAIGSAVFAFGSWTLEDMRVYLDAAQRLRDGDTLYSTTNPRAAYQYAPWFAAAWIPFTYLPEAAVSVLWTGMLLIGSALSVRPVLRRPTWAGVAVAALMLPILVFSSTRSGNVQPLLVAALVIGLNRRWGPVAIAAAASLKAFPLAFALVYLGRGEWRRFAWSVALTLILAAPMLLFDLTQYTVDGPREGTLYALSPIAWAIPVVLLVLATLVAARRRSPHAWLAAAATTVVALPRMLSYDMTFLLGGTAGMDDETRQDKGTAGSRTPDC